MDYLGGTYISQVEADDIVLPMNLWIQNLPVKEIKGFSEKDRIKKLNEGFFNEDAALIKGANNVWCFDLRTKKGFAIINFIKTDRN